VTLRGPVRSEDEKRTIAQKAGEVAGAGNVKDEITVVSADASGKSSKTPKTSTDTSGNKADDTSGKK